MTDALLAANWGFPRSSCPTGTLSSSTGSGKVQHLGTKLLHTTAYHPATDGLTERTIQTLQSALRHFIHALERPEQWPQCLPRLQFEHNNARSTVTGVSPNEAVLGFTPLNIGDIITNKQVTPDRQFPGPASRLSVQDAIAAAAMNAKRHYDRKREHYDRKREPRFFNQRDRVLLRLHKGYAIPRSAQLGKFGPQYAGPFRVTERIGRRGTYKVHTCTLYVRVRI